MNRRIQCSGIVEDDGAQALTEFAIVIPIVLLFFFAMLQYFAIVRASQLANYAAFVAARSYAVQASIDTSSAVDKAEAAAALAMAPVASFVPGEIKVFGDALNPTSSRTGPSALVEGYLVARYVRFNPQFGGSITITNEGDPPQIDVEINYPQPIYVPGLSELWGIVGGGSDIHQDLRTLQGGLGGVVGAANNVQQGAQNAVMQSEPSGFEVLFPGLWGQFANEIGSITGDIADMATGLILPFPYVNVRGKCSIGYEDWGLIATDRPRLPSNPPADSGTGGDQGNQPDNSAQIQQDADNYNSATRADGQACKKNCSAQSQLQQAQQKYNEIKASESSPPTAQQIADLSQARATLSQASKDASDAQAAYNTAHANFLQAQQALENDAGSLSNGQSFPDMPCNCN